MLPNRGIVKVDENVFFFIYELRPVHCHPVTSSSVLPSWSFCFVYFSKCNLFFYQFLFGYIMSIFACTWSLSLLNQKSTIPYNKGLTENCLNCILISFRLTTVFQSSPNIKEFRFKNAVWQMMNMTTRTTNTSY